MRVVDDIPVRSPPIAIDAVSERPGRDARFLRRAEATMADRIVERYGKQADIRDRQCAERPSEWTKRETN